MIEAYAFLAAFAVQILVVSVLYPAWFIRYIRVQAASIPAERLAQMYPGIDLGHAQERFLARYRMLATGIAVLGLLLLGWLFGYTHRPDWGSPAVLVMTAYFLAAQMLPLILVVWLGVRFDRKHKRSSPEGKRTASLQRRGLFDFVSPFIVLLAVLAYFLFAAFVIYIRQHPFPGFGGFINLGVVTLVYALNAFVVYMVLYGTKANPFETHTRRLRRIGLTVKSSVCSCIVLVVFISLILSLGLLDLKRWQPFAISVFFIVCTLLGSLVFAAPLRRPEVEAAH